MIEIMKKNRNILLVIVDILVIIFCYLVSMFFLDIQVNDFINLAKEILVAIVMYETFLNIFQMYRNMMRYEVGKDYIKYILSAVLATIIITAFDVIFDFEYLKLKLNVLSGILSAGLFVMYRLAGRSFFSSQISRVEQKNQKETPKKVSNLLIIGAGLGAREIIISIKNFMRDKYNIIGVIDDDIGKLNHYILGAKVLGNRYSIPKIVEENNVDIIFFAINKIDAISRRKILEICQETGIKTRVLPTTEEVITKQGAINSLRDVQIEDLLGREPVHLDNKNIYSLIKNKVVLVTGRRRLYWF